MVVLILESAPQSLRGELSKWMIEPKAGVFVGTVSGAVRDLIWEKACREVKEGGCTMIFRAANEQGFAIRSHGDTTREIREWEGLFLVTRTNQERILGQPIEQENAFERNLNLEIWGKSPYKFEHYENGAMYHPLICHMLDVSMVTLRLWNCVLPASLKQQIKEQLGVKTDREAGVWMAFFAGLHDMGKSTPAFAVKWPDGWNIMKKGGYTPSRGSESKQHGILTSCLLSKLLQKVTGLPACIAWPVAIVVGGHHGRFPSARELKHSERYTGDGLWPGAQENLVRILACALNIETLTIPQKDLTKGNSLLLLLAGFTSVADWIASDERNFPYAGDQVTLPRYSRRARWLAWIALHRIGWFHRPGRILPLPFLDLFDRKPNKLQEEIIDIATSLKGPSLVLLEYPMGGGKTEAALYLADHLTVFAGQNGLYFALPTMATSNQMFDRVGTYLTNRFPDSMVNVQLLHGHSSLNSEFEVLKKHGMQLIMPKKVNEDEDSGLTAAEWFTYRKRGLLAPYGIGTVDQVLLSVLQAKHFFVRLFGLAGKIVIVDEIHAYDSYMQTLLCRLLTWLAACGSSVILLSATLPASTKDALVGAYAAGRGQIFLSGLNKTEYPRITWFSDEKKGCRHIAEVPKRTMKVDLCLQSDDTWVSRLKNALSEGGCAAVVVNTVSRAQSIYSQLIEHFNQEELILFHARFPFQQRYNLEKEILNRFGPDADDRPKRAVVVATQVLEQSLDLDFDLLVTDLAPIDLILQRSGRMWRHPQRNRPLGISEPTLWVLVPDTDEEGIPEFESGSTYVYNPHTLLRTWLIIRDIDRLTIPTDVEKQIEYVYGETEPSEFSDSIRRYWEQTYSELERSKLVEVLEAQKRYIPDINEDIMFSHLDSLDEDNEALHRAHQALTRLGGPSVTIACLIAKGNGMFAGNTEISFYSKPDVKDIRAILESSIRVSFSPSIVRKIVDLKVPPAWEKSAQLRRMRAVLFDSVGNCLTGGLPLFLDRDLGLVVKKEG